MTESDSPRVARGKAPYPSFDEFFKGEFRSVVGFVQSLGAGFDEAQDATMAAMQEVAVRWSKIDNPRTYVRTVAKRRHFASDVDMRRLREAIAENPHLLRPLPYSVEGTVTEVDAILSAIAKLPSAQRIVLAWTLQSYTIKEIAEMLDQGEDTVRSNLRHARKRMKEELFGEPKIPNPQPRTGRQS